MKKVILLTVIAMLISVAASAEELILDDVYEIGPGTYLQMEVGTCALHFGDVKFRMDLESCDMIIEWDNSGDRSTTSMTGKCKAILTDEDDGLSFYVCGQKRRKILSAPAIDYGPNVKPAVYRPHEDESLIEPETGSVIIDMNDIGGAYMVLDQFGDLVSMGNSYKEIELDPGKYYIIPEEIDYYSARPIIVEVRSGETEEVMIHYEKDLSTEKGTLMVDLIPPFGAYYVTDAYGELVAVGFDSDEFRLSPGVYFIVSQKLDGFITPEAKDIKVTPNGVHRIKVHHKSLDGTPLNLNGVIIASL